MTAKELADELMLTPNLPVYLYAEDGWDSAEITKGNIAHCEGYFLIHR